MALESPSHDYGNSSPSFDYRNSDQLVNQDNDLLSEEDEYHQTNSNTTGDNYKVDERASYLEGHDAEESNDQQQLSEEELQILAEQIAVERELQQMKEEGFLPMEDPPEYDVRDRIAQLNAELAAEGTIPDNRKQSVQFRDDPVTDVFPVIYYEDGDEEEQAVNDDSIDQEVAKLTLKDSEQGIERQSFIQREQMPKKALAFADTKDETSSNNDDTNGHSIEEEKVVVERDGKFEVVDASELSMEERYLMGLEPVDKTETKSTLPNINNSGTHSSSKPRPSTATYSGQEQRSNPPARRVQSARPVNKKTFPSKKPIYVKKTDPFRDGTFSEVGNQKSRYGLTPEQKDYQREMAQLRRDKLREETQSKEEEERRVKSDREQAFHAWVQLKEDESRTKRKQGKRKPEGESDPNKPDPDEVFKSWLEGKKRQSNLEKRFHKQFEEESKLSQQQRSRQECEKTYKAWVRSKNHQLREQQSLSRSHALTSKQQAQRSRKSRTLAKALQVAQTYRYTDYYGYRF